MKLEFYSSHNGIHVLVLNFSCSCIDKILDEQLKKIQTTLQDISTLESAEITANDRLSEVRASMRLNKVRGLN